MSPTDQRPRIRITVPAESAHAPLIRACLRDAMTFGSEDQETSFFVAVTELVDGLIESSDAVSADTGSRPAIVLALFGPPDPRLVIGTTTDRHPPVRLGLGGAG